MNIDHSRIEYLFERYFFKIATPEEIRELSALVNQGEDEVIDDLLAKTWKKFDSKEPVLSSHRAKEILDTILQAKKSTRVIVLKRIAVAASVVFALGLGAYFLFINKSNRQPDVVAKEQKTDVPAPTVARATLKLDDGRIVYLDSVGNGQVAIQGNVSVVKNADGEISYQSTVGSEQLAVKYNTISNPRGSKVQTVTLIDGTQVWLNAESSITYPTAFVGKERKVTMTGEAYFEVSHDVSKKFIVDANGVTTEVLGTHFNVNAYADEEAIRVTLSEGLVKVKKSNVSIMIKPGEQAVSLNSGQLAINKNVDIEQVMAWKEGLFNMKSADIGTIMRQIGRWYDVEVEYQNGVPKGTISGEVPRNLNLSEVLKVYEYSGVHFTIEGNKIIVKP